MKLVIQRARQGCVTVAGTCIGHIEAGIVVLAGFGSSDGPDLPDSVIWRTMLKKMLELRIFPDSSGKMNRSLGDFGGQILLVPQFTLYADVRKGRRPSFVDACPPDVAIGLFDRLVTDVRQAMALAGCDPDHAVRQGQFGADMDVALTNWGPVTILLNDTDFGRA